jgi:hypothetical protein
MLLAGITLTVWALVFVAYAVAAARLGGPPSAAWFFLALAALFPFLFAKRAHLEADAEGAFLRGYQRGHDLRDFRWQDVRAGVLKLGAKEAWLLADVDEGHIAWHLRPGANTQALAEHLPTWCPSLRIERE